ncbi:alkaline-phosphatase-like protein [Limtongia smithiae]|uniref:alkaline-phosphatase-like protein n=1 Tax=Limtongia smithiae TaxID=1125753 RepID=UPI0034CE5FC5
MLPNGLVTAFILPLQIIGLLFFVKGFFPYKPVFHGYAPLEPDTAPPVFDKIVFMLVDALRSDFVFANTSSMTFTKSLITSGDALPFTAHAAPPTVTLPRIKGLSTGSVPNFLDAVLNIAESDDSSSLANQDSWLAQIRRRERHEDDQYTSGKLVHFGDDTWLKLFPEMFDRYDGTSSFFVSDFTEVDNNVTRHIDSELTRNDWDLMVLHYLGVDHIGHKGGPDSPFMPGKLHEMDDIFSKLFTNARERYESRQELVLLILCGDHGMNEMGNHGGSSPGETAAALLFASPVFSELKISTELPARQSSNFDYYKVVEQVDIVPTISALLGDPFPLNNIGVIIEDFLQLWKESDQIQILTHNAIQMHRILREAFPSVDRQVENIGKALTETDVERLGRLWQMIQTGNTSVPADKATFYEFLNLGQTLLSRTSSNYDMLSLILGLLLVTWATIIACGRALALSESNYLTTAAFFVGITLYGFSMFGSSLVEEEQYFWYWLATGWFAFQFCQNVLQQSSRGWLVWAGQFALLTVARHYNHTGQKYAGSLDISQFLSQETTSGLLWVLIIVQHLVVLKNLHFYVFTDTPPVMAFVCTIAPVFSLFTFKVSMALEAGEVVPKLIEVMTPTSKGAEQLQGRARTTFLAITVCFLFHTLSTVWNPKKDAFRYLRGVLYIAELLFIAQSTTTNIPAFLIFEFVHSLLRRFAVYRQTKSLDLVFTAIIWQQVAFFALGKSNSLSSLDLSNAYNGISGYYMIPVGILLFIGNWYGPIFFTLSALVQIAIWKSNHTTSTDSSLESLISSEYLALVHAFHSVALLAVMGACMVLRSHLFVWTVFSPKLLYSVAWSVLQQGLVDTLVGLGLVVVSETL